MKDKFLSIVISMHWFKSFKTAARILFLGGAIMLAPVVGSAECPINNADEVFSFFTNCQAQPTPTPIPGYVGAIAPDADTAEFLVQLVQADVSGATTKTIEDGTIKIVTADTGASEDAKDSAYKQAVEDGVYVDPVDEAPVDEEGDPEGEK